MGVNFVLVKVFFVIGIALNLTLVRQVLCLQPLYKVYETLIFQSNYLPMDETSLRVLEDGKGKCYLGYLWAVFDPVRRYPFFFYLTGRDHQYPKKLLERFSGALQTNGYSVNETLNSKLPNLFLVNCMSHIRREFFEAKGNDENRANAALTFIQQLYKVEQEARDAQMSSEERAKLRLEKSTVPFSKFKKWCIEEYPKVPSAKPLPTPCAEWTIWRCI